MLQAKIQLVMIKIQSGKFCGRNIATPPGSDTRPPLSRVRKAVFDTLRPYLTGANILDMFGGSGSYSFEALSNDADKATIIELSGAAVNTIKETAKSLGVSDRINVVRDDAFTAIPRLARQSVIFDVIFIAPPQRKGMVERSLEVISNNPVYDENTIIVCQFETREVGDLNSPPYTEWKRQVYGRTEVVWLECEG